MEDMSNLIKQFSEMIEKDGIPENLKEVIGDLDLSNLNLDKLNLNKDSAQDDSANDSNSSDSSKDKHSKGTSSSPFGFDGIDIGTLLKLQGMMSKMSSKDDPRSNLLLSLKPYLKDSRKSKIEQYIQFMNIAKMMDTFKGTGGDNKNDS